MDMKKRLTAALLAFGLAAFGLACGDTGSVDRDPDGRCDYWVIPGIADGSPYRVATERDCGVSLTIPVIVTVDFLAGDIAGTQSSSFVLDKTIVSYFNVTQNSGQPSAVPAPFQWTPAIVAGTGGSLPAEVEFLTAPLLQQSARTQFPLNDDNFYRTGTDPISGVVLEATIVFWGHPVNQESRECRGTMVFRFTIFDAYDFDPLAEAAQCEFEADNEMSRAL
jgi:hypothetical protein